VTLQCKQQNRNIYAFFERLRSFSRRDFNRASNADNGSIYFRPSAVPRQRGQAVKQRHDLRVVALLRALPRRHAILVRGGNVRAVAQQPARLTTVVSGLASERSAPPLRAVDCSWASLIASSLF